MFNNIIKNKSDDDIRIIISKLKSDKKKLFLESLSEGGKAWAIVGLAKLLKNSDPKNLHEKIELLIKAIELGNNDAKSALSDVFIESDKLIEEPDRKIIINHMVEYFEIDDFIDVLNNISLTANEYDIFFSKLKSSNSDDDIKKFISELSYTPKRRFLEILSDEGKTWAIVGLAVILTDTNTEELHKKIKLLVNAIELGDNDAKPILSNVFIKSDKLIEESYRKRIINHLLEDYENDNLIDVLNNASLTEDEYDSFFNKIKNGESDDEIKKFISKLEYTPKKVFLEILSSENKAWAMLELAKILDGSENEQFYSKVNLLTRSIKSGNNQAVDELSNIVHFIPNSIPGNKKEEILLQSAELGCVRAELELVSYYNNEAHDNKPTLQWADKITSRFMNKFNINTANNQNYYRHLLDTYRDEFNVFLTAGELYYSIKEIKNAGLLFEYVVDVFNSAGVDYLKNIKESLVPMISDSLYILGGCYNDGKEIECSIDKSIKCYLTSSELGNSDAQTALGICYYKGIGVPKNETKVRYWISKAIEQDNVKALDFVEKHPEFKENGVKNINYNANGDIIQGNVGVLAKDDAIVNRSNVSLDNDKETIAKNDAIVNRQNISFDDKSDEVIGDDTVINNTFNLNEEKQEFKFCIYCGEKLPVKAKFCMKCGERI